MNQELSRLQQESEKSEKRVFWKKWGPYLSERQWGTVREDYSENGDAWSYVSHDHARSRAYRWGEDGIGGISDDQQRICFALAMWNEKDPILKERLFGLTNSEGNHGEDVKEYYFYLDSTPTHSYMKYLYKYVQDAYPYADIVATNARRSRMEMEYELLDTGIFANDNYFDVFLEYAKADAEDILIKVVIENRGSQAAPLVMLPTLWFRNTWSWYPDSYKPGMSAVSNTNGYAAIQAEHKEMGKYTLLCEGSPELLFTENETNQQRIFQRENPTPYVKDGIHNYLVHQKREGVNPQQVGTKASACYRLHIAAGGRAEIRLRLRSSSFTGSPFDAQFEEIFSIRKLEADQYFDQITPDTLTSDQAMVMRQAIAGMLWSKQYYYYDLELWLEEHKAIRGNRTIRNQQWFHMYNNDIISMPDKWEYPWYAAWDLAFHNIVFVSVDPVFAKKQLDLMLRGFYLHPNGQIPAYEWNFSDVNPPVHAWATFYVYTIDRQMQGKPDLDFLRHAFQKLLINFTWWVNRKDNGGNNIFEGGFLGLDNIGIFDRSSPLPTGGYLEQADGTAWMAMFSLNMLEIALELSKYDPAYEDFAVKFFEHFLWIAAAMDKIGDQADELWDEKDGFFYDVLRQPDGTTTRIKLRSMVGLLPLVAVTVIEPGIYSKMTALAESQNRILQYHPELLANIALPDHPGKGGRRLLSILNEKKLRQVLTSLLDDEEFLSEFGIRSLSKVYQNHPFELFLGGLYHRVQYLPAESDNGMFGGNSNWRGPIWMPVNLLLIRALLYYYSYYGDSFTIEFPSRSGKFMNLYQISQELSRRLENIFLRDKDGRRPVMGGAQKFQTDPHWKDYLLFYEYFHGDNGAGLGASHQTGWTGVIARLIQLFGFADSDSFLKKEMEFQASYQEN